MECANTTAVQFVDALGALCGCSTCVAAVSETWRAREKFPAWSSQAGRQSGAEGRTTGMYVNDPVADMLTRIRNANTVYHETVDMPMSRMRLEMARILKDEGYIRNYKTISDTKMPVPTLRITMSYSSAKERVIQGLRRVSKPGRRIYVQKDELPKVMGGLGIAMISTSSGLMTDAEARKRGLGGEVVCFVW